MGVGPQLILVIPFVLAFFAYMLAIIVSNRTYKEWPLYRTLCWGTGILFATVAVFGPLAEKAHMDFTVHMVGHLFLGMIAPLLMALAAPMTLLLRTLSVSRARNVMRVLKTKPFRFLTDPFIASILNIGGLWLLYTTSLYTAMHEYAFIHVLIHAHVFLAGYIFTISMIYIDPIPHRTSYMYRSIILIIALAGHGILSKFLYANPPAGVAITDAEKGSMLMYYGGDAVDIVIIFILCLQWYRSTRPKQMFESQHSI
nr:cytochrome c oxidase assembly protein [Halalkalibacter wakoensis]